MNVKMAKKYLLILFIYIGTLWPWLQYKVSSVFTYWDELLALLFIPLFIPFFLYNMFEKKRRIDLLLWMVIAVFVAAGFVGYFTNEYANIKTTISDCFLNIKFFMLLYTIFGIYRVWNWQIYRKAIEKHLDFLSCILLFLVLVDRIFKIFPIYEIRFGINSEQLMFMHPSFCAAVFFYLLMLRILFGCICKFKNIAINISIGIAIFLTLRLKAIVTMFMLIVILLYTYNPKWKQFKWPIIICGIAGSFILAYDQIWGYFLSPDSMKYARGALLWTSFKILKDYFPFGTGFATFGSYLSGVNYSQVYSLYNINTVYGMTQDNYNAISDQYWPMIAGQTGLVGLISMITIWYMLYKKIKTNKNITKNQSVAATASLIYIIVCSTAESAICNPVCMPLAIILGLTYAQLEYTEERQDIHE